MQRTDFLKRSITVIFLKTRRGPVRGGETDMGTVLFFCDDGNVFCAVTVTLHMPMECLKCG